MCSSGGGSNRITQAFANAALPADRNPLKPKPRPVKGLQPMPMTGKQTFGAPSLVRQKTALGG